MTETSDSNHLDTVYVEASEWIRMCNAILWAMGTLLVPTSPACIGLTLEHPERKFVLAPISVFLFAFWVYASRLYRASAASAREVLMNIEKEWRLRDEVALFTLHGQVGKKRYSLFNTQVLCLIILIVLWVSLLVWLPQTASPKT
jgi:hypothetical protein